MNHFCEQKKSSGFKEHAHKRLSLNPTPPVDGYLNQAYPLSILSTDDAYLPWFFSNYIQLYCPEDFPPGHYNFFMHAAYPALICPLLDIQWFNQDIIQGGNIVQFVINSLQSEYYIQLFVDEFFLPERTNFARNHFIHDLLIFGYDQEETKFDIIGYNDQGVYAPGMVSFSDLENAFNSVRLLPAYNEIKFFRKFWLARRVSDYKCSFDLTSVVEQLEDFFHGRDTSCRFRMINSPTEMGAYRFQEKDLYGRATYDSLRNYLDLLAAGECSFNPIPLHTFWQHKRCMAWRIRYMESHGLLEPRHFAVFEHIQKSAETLRMMVLRYSMRRDPKLLDRARDRFDQISADEQAAFEDLLQTLTFQGQAV